MPPRSRAGWTLIAGGLLLGVTATSALGFAQVQEGRAQRLLRRFNPDTGAHPVFADAQRDYEQYLQRASTLRSVAFSTGISAGVLLATGALLALLSKAPKARSQARLSAKRGLTLRF